MEQTLSEAYHIIYTIYTIPIELMFWHRYVWQPEELNNQVLSEDRSSRKNSQVYRTVLSA